MSMGKLKGNLAKLNLPPPPQAKPLTEQEKETIKRTSSTRTIRANGNAEDSKNSSATKFVKSNLPRTPSELKQKDRVLASVKDIDRSDWLQRVLKENPEIANMKERIQPLERLISFGNTYLRQRKEIKDTMSKEEILQLILQFFHVEGLKASRSKLEEMTRVKLNPALMEQSNESRLVTILRIIMKDTERLWDLTMADRYQDSEENQLDLEEHLYDLGMLEEDPESTEDTNIWEEPEEGNILYDSKGLIKAATLNKLVERLTAEKNHDMAFQKTFLMTYQSFTSPEKLIRKLIQRYQVPNVPVGNETPQDLKARTKQIQLRIVNVIQKWLEGHFLDLNDQHIESLRTFLVKYVKPDSETLYTKLEGALQRKVEMSKTPPKDIVFSDPPPDPKVDIKTIFLPNLEFIDLDETEIARQLTIIEFELFANIQPTELLNQAWNKPKLKHRASNVLAMINRSNEVSGWVAAMILKQEKLRTRARMWINTLMSILAGMNNSAVYRLTITREEVPGQIHKIYDSLMASVSTHSGYKNYRDMLASADPPCIPYLGVYLTDLTFIDEGNPNFLPSGGKDLINFHKRRLVFNVIDAIQQYQQSRYNLQPVHQIQALLRTEKMRQQRLDEKEMWKLSQLREPRGADRSTLL